MNKEQLALEVISRLKTEYPNTGCSLIYDEPWKLLVAVRLAAQCTDERVNLVTPILFEKYPTIVSLANAPYNDVAQIVKSCGLTKQKSLDIIACMKLLHEKYQDTVPDNMNDLLQLPGVGRKSANLILGDIYHQSAIVTDTHCIRLSNRIGLVDNETTPAKVETLLRKLIPADESNDLCHRFVDHGRIICTARTAPKCDECCLNNICKKKILPK